MLLNLVIGAIGSLLASAVFLFILFRYRPRLLLSTQIAKTTYADKAVYAFKVLNSGHRDAVAIKAEVLMIEPQVIVGGVGRNVLQVSLVRDNWFVLRPLSKVGDKVLDATFEFITCENVEQEWATHANSYLVFRVQAQDALSGFSAVFSSEISSRNEIKVGRFAKGQSMAISA
jgi:hypothetical protein